MSLETLQPYYICIEGIEGMGKTTQVELLCEWLRQKYGKERIVQTGEPGTKLSPISMDFRNMMLNQEWGSKMNPLSREYIGQAARSQIYHDVIIPSLKQGKIIVSDRGILSGLAYGVSCGNNMDDLCLLKTLTTKSLREVRPNLPIYDLILLLKGNAKEGLQRAKTSKREFKKGDFIEDKGIEFMAKVQEEMIHLIDSFETPALVINIENKTILQVHQEITELINFYYIKK